MTIGPSEVLLELAQATPDIESVVHTPNSAAGRSYFARFREIAERIGAFIGRLRRPPCSGFVPEHPSDLFEPDESLSSGTEQNTAPAPLFSAACWYVGLHGHPIGPMPSSTLCQMVAGGVIDGEALVWREGLNNWLEVRSFPVLRGLLDEATVHQTGGNRGPLRASLNLTASAPKSAASPPSFVPRMRTGANQSRPFVAIHGDESLMVGAVRLAHRGGAPHPLCPPLHGSESYCIDGVTANTLHFIAECVTRREPCLLEGPTGTSKTSSILYLASLLGQPVLRLNLDGQTDPSVLIGRYVPQAESRSFVWQPGPLVRAAKEGIWLVLDEVNLAEPAVLERLNPVLEDRPTLLVSEGDNELLGTAHNPIHPDFRVFATMNPSDYAGRSELSPAFRNRWVWRWIDQASRTDLMALLYVLVFGQQPPVSTGSYMYEPWRVTATYPKLGAFPDIRPALTALARFHEGVVAACEVSFDGTRGIGGARRAGYTFTRRDLVRVLEYAATANEPEPLAPILRKAVRRYYVGAVRDDADRRAIETLMEAVGL